MKKLLALTAALMLCLLPALSLAADLRFTTDVIKQGHSLYLGTYDDAPIEWLVLSPNKSSTGQSGGTFLIARDLLTTTTFDTQNYLSSNLRSLCTSTYISSFNPAEKAIIMSTSTDDEASEDVLANDLRVYPAPLSDDKLFLLSYAEIEAHLPAEYRAADPAWYTRNKTEFNLDPSLAGYLVCNKWGDYSYVTTKYPFSGGFRPGMNIMLDGAAYITPAAGGKSDALGLTPIREQAGVTAWRLTLEHSVKTFSAKVSETVYSDDRTVEIDVTAPYGYRDICCILMEMNGEATHYGLVATQNGKATFTLPEELPNGTYGLMLFGEQRNGDNRTDYMTTQVLTSVTLTDRPAVTPTPTPAPSVPATGDGAPLTLLALLGGCSLIALLLLCRKARS